MKCPPRKFVKQAESLGYQLLRANKHAIWRHSSGVQVVTAITPSCHRAERNALVMMRRLAGSTPA